MTVTFQLAQKDDLAVLLPFMQALFESDNPPTNQPFDEPTARQAVLDLLKKPDFGRVGFEDHDRYLMTKWLK